MNHPIARLYATAQQAAAAVARLKQHGFADDQINPVTPDDAGSDAGVITEKIASGNVLRSSARAYAEGVRRGASFVSVQAPFGMGGDATAVLDSFEPLESPVPDVREPTLRWDDAAPLSSALRWPALVKGDPTFSGFFSMKILSKRGWTLGSLLGIPELSGSGRQSSTFGVGLLANSSMSLSSKLGLPLLKSSGLRR